MEMPDRARNNSSSLRRALAILDVLARDETPRSGASLTELSIEAAASKSTVLRLLAPLLERGLVEQNADGRYAIGVGAVTLGSAYLNRLDLRAVAHPILTELAAAAKETIHLVVYNDGQIVYVDKIAGPSPIQMASRVGDRAPVHSTGGGKAILAHLPTDEFERIVQAGLPARTPQTLTTRDALASSLARVRSQGYSIDDVENEDGIRCVAAPVFDHTGAVVAAVSASGPAEDVRQHLSELTPLILAATRAISARMGARSSGTPADSVFTTTTKEPS
jgi:DNA-binding IclR family transcriptional regulator